MSAKTQKILSGWGNNPRVKCHLFRPERVSDLPAVEKACHAGYVARGLGRSYGDASLAKSGTILTERLNRFLSFDAKKGLLCAEAGVSLAEVLELVVPQGWMVPVVPGTKYVTLGGCVASNVHGKNAYKKGEFCTHVKEISLRLANGKTLLCGPKNNAEIFWATAGGMGMTGVIEEVTLQLMPIASAVLECERAKVSNIDDMLRKFRNAQKKTPDYMVGWIDHFGKGKSLGRGIFEAAWHSKQKSEAHTLSEFRVKGAEFDVPFYLPSFVLNKYVMALYNKMHFAKLKASKERKKEKFETFFHPLDGIGAWHKLYGRRGFLQYQCLIPDGKNVSKNIKNLLKLIQEQKQFSFLAVIKYHGKREGAMSFSDKGFSIALDFPNTKRVRKLLDELDVYVASLGGRVYLAKDGRMQPEMFEKMHKGVLPKWRAVLKKLDPKNKITSNMNERLGFKKSAK